MDWTVIYLAIGSALLIFLVYCQHRYRSSIEIELNLTSKSYIEKTKKWFFSHILRHHILLSIGTLFLVSGFQYIMMPKEDMAMDWLQKVQVFYKDGIPPLPESLPPFTLINIDDNTYKEWNYPIFTPRDKLKALIEAAVNGKAKYIIVNIDINQDTPIDGIGQLLANTPDDNHLKIQLLEEIQSIATDSSKLHPNDKILYDYLEEYSRTCANQACPPILLTKTLYEKPLNVSSFTLTDLPHPITEARSVYLDQFITATNNSVQWVDPLFVLSDEDKTIRRWRLWSSVCTEDKGSVMPSTQLLVSTMIRCDLPLKQARERLDEQLKTFVPTQCPTQQSVAYHKETPKKIKICDNLEVKTDRFSIEQRIVYGIPFMDGKPSYIAANTNQSILKVVPAKVVEKFNSHDNDLFFKDKIVLIDNTNKDNPKVLTPIESMPNSFVIINAIYSMLKTESGQIEPLHIGYKSIIVLFFTLVASFSFVVAFPSTLVAFVVNIIFVILVMFPASYYLYSSFSQWFNFFIPLIAIQSYQLLIDVYQYQRIGYNKSGSIFMSTLVVLLTLLILFLYVLT